MLFRSVGTIVVKQVEFGEETQLVAVSDIGVVFVHGPEESIFFSTAASIETISQMRCKDVFSRVEMCCQIVADILDGAMVVRPYKQ